MAQKFFQIFVTFHMGGGMITLYRGDITRLKVDAIVNAANSSLLGGGGVDGAIHRAAGPELKAYCAKLGGCPTGEARITPGFRLPARYVIHAVGPIWRGGNQNEDELLRSAYRSALQLALEHQLHTVAFPNISTGVYGFPKERAAQIAIPTVLAFLQEHEYPKHIIFCIFDPENFAIYQNYLDRHHVPYELME